jgi:hypothetical protein
MTIHHRRIKSMAAAYRVEADLDPERDVLVSAEGSDLTNGERLNDTLGALEGRLRDDGTEDREIYAIKNIVLELAGNAVLHGAGPPNQPELLVVSRHGPKVQVWLFGYGRTRQVDRLMKIIRAIGAIAKPPDHREKLLKKRNDDLVRRSASPPSEEHGGGVGMLTIAALSSEPLWFKLNQTDGYSSFALRSTVRVT